MGLSEISLDVPIILQSLYQRKNLQNPLGAKSARSCARNGRFLQVRASGEYAFDAKAPDDWELFTMESDASCPGAE
ncbi:Phosphatidate cytidylyltransferase [Phytophthora cinnamomi]|uniref:Phosphatidate cytidylyltransferase n=1 Tax=Phytophthora cinnamomi TaxID=4785 RepID=UPI003559480B|nr:Phosphatidate cytidylyltransferase [Phytophthora cinnamomi]